MSPGISSLFKSRMLVHKKKKAAREMKKIRGSRDYLSLSRLIARQEILLRNAKVLESEQISKDALQKEYSDVKTQLPSEGEIFNLSGNEKLLFGLKKGRAKLHAEMRDAARMKRGIPVKRKPKN